MLNAFNHNHRFDSTIFFYTKFLFTRSAIAKLWKSPVALAQPVLEFLLLTNKGINSIFTTKTMAELDRALFSGILGI